MLTIFWKCLLAVFWRLFPFFLLYFRHTHLNHMYTLNKTYFIVMKVHFTIFVLSTDLEIERINCL